MISSPTVAIVSLFNFSHYNVYSAISLCFKFHFSDNKWCLPLLIQMLVNHMLLCAMYIQVSYQISLDGLSYYWVLRIIYILWIRTFCQKKKKNLLSQTCILFYFFKIIFIDMNQPWIYMCSPFQSPLPPPSPSHPSGSSQCTSPEHLSHASNQGWWSVSPLIVYLFDAILSEHPNLSFSHRV